MWTNEEMNRTLKVHSVHIKINEEQFEYLSIKGNKSEYMRELIEKDMQGGNDSTILLEALRLIVLKSSEVLPVVKPVMVKQSVQVGRTVEPVQFPLRICNFIMRASPSRACLTGAFIKL